MPSRPGFTSQTEGQINPATALALSQSARRTCSCSADPGCTPSQKADPAPRNPSPSMPDSLHEASTAKAPAHSRRLFPHLHQSVPHASCSLTDIAPDEECCHLKINIKLRPIEMSWRRKLDMHNLSDGRFTEP